jgi:hypothetical protein
MQLQVNWEGIKDLSASRRKRTSGHRGQVVVVRIIAVDKGLQLRGGKCHTHIVKRSLREGSCMHYRSCLNAYLLTAADNTPEDAAPG